MSQYFEWFSRVSLFGDLPREALDVLGEIAQKRSFDRGDLLFREGEPAGTLYLLLEGRIKLTQLTEDGHIVAPRTVGPGQLFGAAFGREEYPISAQALEQCNCLCWSRSRLMEVMRRFPDLAFNALNMVAGQLHQLQERFRALATERVEKRLAHLLLFLARQKGSRVLLINRQDLAEMTGATQFTISRVLAVFAKEGWVTTGREKVTLENEAALKAFVSPESGA